MAGRQTIIVFCAHSDDQIFGPGATLAKYVQEGKEVYTVIFSYGESSLPWLKPEIAIKTRVEEGQEADKLIGGSGVTFFGLKEGKFIEEAKEKDLINTIERILESKQPVKIFTHSPEDPHPDHRDVYKIIIQALDEIKYNCDVYAFDVWNPFTINQSNFPKMYEDVTHTFSKKIKALRLFKSQQLSLLALVWSVYVRAIAHGFHIHKRFAERFFKVR